MTKQMFITFILTLTTVFISASEANQDRLVSAYIGAGIVWVLTAVFFRQKQVYARRVARAAQ